MIVTGGAALLLAMAAPVIQASETQTWNYFAAGNSCNEGAFGILPSAHVCLVFDGTQADINVNDVTGLPVSAYYTFYDNVGQIGSGAFCDTISLPVPEGANSIKIDVNSYIGACLPFPGFGTYGNITLTTR